MILSKKFNWGNKKENMILDLFGSNSDTFAKTKSNYIKKFFNFLFVYSEYLSTKNIQSIRIKNFKNATK
jgi:hypothetical protein